jgi:hypothetical protein
MSSSIFRCGRVFRCRRHPPAISRVLTKILNFEHSRDLPPSSLFAAIIFSSGAELCVNNRRVGTRAFQRGPLKYLLTAFAQREPSHSV